MCDFLKAEKELKAQSEVVADPNEIFAHLFKNSIKDLFVHDSCAAFIPRHI